MFSLVADMESTYHYAAGKITEANGMIAEYNSKIHEWTVHKSEQQGILDKHIKNLMELRAKITKAMQPKVEPVKLGKAKAVAEDSLDALENRSNVEKSHGKSKSQRSSG